MPKILKKLFKYKCMELMCNTIHRQDKWLEHCKKKHPYKVKNKIDIKYKIVEVKIEGRPWEKWTDNMDTSDSTSRSPSEELTSNDSIDLSKEKREKEHYTPSSSDSIPSTSEISSSLTSLPDTNDDNTRKCEENNSKTTENLSALHSEEKIIISKNESHLLSQVVNSSQSDLVQIDPLDPATYTGIRLNEQDVNSALKIENYKYDPSFEYPSVNNRRFLLNWRKCNLPDGTVRDRKWLVYSKKEDAAFCLHCLLFSLPNEHTVWSTTGYKGWQMGNAVRDIELHESSKFHLRCQTARIQWISKTHINRKIIQAFNEEIQHHREVLSVIIDCCRYLSEEMIAFRKNKFINGKLVKLFKLLAKYSPDARVYYEKIEKYRQSKKKLGFNFLSYQNVFDLILVMSRLVTEKVVQHTKETNKYSVILDSTQDVSKKEATAVLIRYVEHNNHIAKPCERLINVFTSGDTSGIHLKQKLIECLQTVGLDANNIVGQSMDGAGNMRGCYCGLKTLILNDYKTAFYTWCSSHRFALVIEKSIDMCPLIRNLFLLLEEINVFMSGHKRHMTFIDNLKPSQKKRRLKRVQTTRWSSKDQAVKTLLACYSEVRTTLYDLYSAEKSDKDTVVLAKALFDKLGSYDTAAGLLICDSIFTVLSPVTVSLQGINIDYGTVQEIIRSVKDNLVYMRCDSTWSHVLSKIEDFCSHHELPEPAQKRVKKKKRFMDEIGIDECIIDHKRKLKVDVYFRVLDSLINQLEDRFSDHSLNIVKQMTHFTHNGVLQVREESVKPEDVQELCEYYNLDSECICQELQDFSELNNASHESVSLDDILMTKEETNEKEKADQSNMKKEEDEVDETVVIPASQKLNDLWISRGFLKPYRCLTNFSSFDNLIVLYRILLSLAVTSCSAERAMSRISIIKNRLRSCMGDTWLSNLMILCSEKDILATISNDDIIDNFSSTSPFRKKLLTKM